MYTAARHLKYMIHEEYGHVHAADLIKKHVPDASQQSIAIFLIGHNSWRVDRVPSRSYLLFIYIIYILYTVRDV